MEISRSIVLKQSKAVKEPRKKAADAEERHNVSHEEPLGIVATLAGRSPAGRRNSKVESNS